MLTVISLGAGVQSSTMALMAAAGEITPMPDCAIFADTGAEPGAVYEWLGWLETQLPFPVVRVMWKHGLTEAIEHNATAGRFATAPFFVDTGNGIVGQLRRQCTREYKLQPIIREVRRMAGVVPSSRGPKELVVEQWIGISRDEAHRMKPSRLRWIRHRFPLIDASLTRSDCLLWMERHGYPKPPRSACVFCPYHSDDEWRNLRDNHPADWTEAVRVDALIRSGVRGVRDPIYAHRSLKPLGQVDLTTAEDHGQVSMFGNECEGMCGV